MKLANQRFMWNLCIERRREAEKKLIKEKKLKNKRLEEPIQVNARDGKANR